MIFVSNMYKLIDLQVRLYLSLVCVVNVNIFNICFEHLCGSRESGLVCLPNGFNMISMN